jgi:arylsulfatase A-like enzyme
VEAPTIDGSPRRGKIYPDNYWRNGEPVGETHKFSAELVSDEVIRWLEQIDQERPFFIYIPYSEVHVPIASPQRFIDQYSEFISDHARNNPDIFHFDFKNQPYRGSGEYYANISFLDEQMGRVLEKLEAMGKTENTIVIFSSDNGPVSKESRKPWELSMAGETHGLRGRKDNLFEGGIRVPAIIRYPSSIKGGQVSDQPVHGLDILPTLSDLLDFELPADREIDGQSIAVTFQGNSLNRRKPLNGRYVTETGK